MHFSNRFFLLTLIILFLGGISNSSLVQTARVPVDEPLSPRETRCFKSPDEQCYLKIQNRGKTLKGIYEPHKFRPFIEIGDQAEFKSAWEDNPLYVLANLSHAAYIADEEVAAMIKGFGGDVLLFRHNGQQGFLGIWPDKSILAFRGTDEPKNALDNLKTDPVPFQGITIHRGFRDATLELWDDAGIAGHLDDARQKPDNPEKMYVTGHSLGAAMAVVSALIYPFHQVITFGEPRVGDKIGALLDGKTEHIRVVNGNDNVTTVPPGFLGYRHHGTEVAIRDPESISYNIALSGINTDHSIINYCRNLWLQGPIAAQ